METDWAMAEFSPRRLSSQYRKSLLEMDGDDDANKEVTMPTYVPRKSLRASMMCSAARIYQWCFNDGIF